MPGTQGYFYLQKSPFPIYSICNALSLLNVTFITLGERICTKKSLKGYFSLKICLILVVQKSMTMYIDINITEEELMQESKIKWLEWL